MYNNDIPNQMYGNNHPNHISLLGDDFYQPNSVYLTGARKSFAEPIPAKLVPVEVVPQVRAAPHVKEAFGRDPQQCQIWQLLRPIVLVERAAGIFPIAVSEDGTYKVTPQWLAYSAGVALLVVGLVGYSKWQSIGTDKSSTEGKFEEAVIEYLFTVYFLPIIINPLACWESRKLARLLNDWVVLEQLYNNVTSRRFRLNLGNKPTVLAIALPVIACAIMVVSHYTMGQFRILRVIPYCYINVVIFLVGGSWFIYCDLAGRVGLLAAEQFQLALRDGTPSNSKVADYRGLWMLLARLTRDLGGALSCTLIFLCLYLFLVITLTIYGLLSQIQEGFGRKDLGLCITAVFATVMLFFICDEAHYASNCVKVQFQKKLLLVELSYMNDDAREELNMFLRATEMNPTDISLGGFFDVNRNLFKGLIATMVTYLVVLLQFQISIPEESNVSSNVTAVVTTVASQPQ